MKERPSPPILVRRALYGGRGKGDFIKRQKQFFDRVEKHNSRDRDIESTEEICASRFHTKLHGQVNNQIGNRIQYVCLICKEKWLERSRTAEQVNEEALQEGLEAARILVQMAREGLISIPDLPKWPEQESIDDSSGTYSPYEENDLPNAKKMVANAYSNDYDINRQYQKYKFDEEELEERKNRIIGTDSALPLDVFSLILDKAIDTEPKCALDLLVPDWNACKREHPTVERSLHLTRVVTYTKGVGYESSSFTANFDHGDEHILLPMKALDDRVLTLNKWCYDETVRLFYQKGTQVFQLAKDTLPNDLATQAFLFHVEDTYPIRGEDMRKFLPFDDDLPTVPNRITPLGESYIFKLLRHLVVHSPLALMDVSARTMVDPKIEISEENIEALDMAIDLDRATPIWLAWSQMPQLESVLLDLRIYSHELNTERGCIGKDEIISRAREMGRWLKLKLLVIAGLQSYDFATSYESYTAKRIEDEDEINGEPNWIRIFMPAVQPGGRIILVDRLADDLSILFE
ncbi:uncharacterized protein GGS22DRAFT_195557 [Annulohypoxylon maeteangense]|uniref:uncharacterized protein n=1 Tax=Annulohypoxylon maeteangense TaxID=1927788 RepID=UPI002007210A|nr:uncharacterized protein GGS22DRAFT_195557 [Annulohypoxylon maeteangense]KAI0882828.1 hypothetical protein GGS22DRAFT_195557 [Annulohypoxylon maeteangense]